MTIYVLDVLIGAVLAAAYIFLGVYQIGSWPPFPIWLLIPIFGVAAGVVGLALREHPPRLRWRKRP